MEIENFKFKSKRFLDFQSVIVEGEESGFRTDLKIFGSKGGGKSRLCKLRKHEGKRRLGLARRGGGLQV